MNVPSLAREVVRRLVGEALARVRKVARVLLGRQLAVPAGAEERPVEKDAAADVRVDQALAPARRVLAGRLRLGAEPRWRKPSSPLRSESVPAVTATATASVARTARGRRLAPRERESQHGGDREIEAEQARERRAERHAEAARDDRDERAGAPGRRVGHGSVRDRRREPSSPTAARSCSPRNEPWRPPAPPTKPTAPQKHRRTTVYATISSASAASRSRVSRNAAAPSVSAANSASLPGRGQRGGSVRDRGADDQERERRGRRQQPGRRQRAPRPEAQAGEDRSHEQRDVRRADGDGRSGDSEVDAREVA